MSINTTGWWGGGRQWVAACALTLAAGLACPASLVPGAPADAGFDEASGVSLFAFDSAAIPFSQNLRLEMRSPSKHPANPVVRRGARGSPDVLGVQFYGSVLREAGKFRMWYVAFDDDTANPAPSTRWHAAYAESRDGVRWIKPTWVSWSLAETGTTISSSRVLRRWAAST